MVKTARFSGPNVDLPPLAASKRVRPALCGQLVTLACVTQGAFGSAATRAVLTMRPASRDPRCPGSQAVAAETGKKTRGKKPAAPSGTALSPLSSRSEAPRHLHRQARRADRTQERTFR